MYMKNNIQMEKQKTISKHVQSYIPSCSVIQGTGNYKYMMPPSVYLNINAYDIDIQGSIMM